MNAPTLITRTTKAVDWLSEVEMGKHEARIEAAENRDEATAEIAKERLKAKIERLSPIDIIAGLESMTVKKHGEALRAAWLESPEAFGEFLKSVCVQNMEFEAEIEANEVLLRVEGY